MVLSVTKTLNLVCDWLLLAQMEPCIFFLYLRITPVNMAIYFYILIWEIYTRLCRVMWLNLCLACWNMVRYLIFCLVFKGRFHCSLFIDRMLFYNNHIHHIISNLVRSTHQSSKSSQNSFTNHYKVQLFFHCVYTLSMSDRNWPNVFRSLGWKFSLLLNLHYCICLYARRNVSYV